MAKLESALVAAALQQNPEEALKAFSYLENLDVIRPESLVALSVVSTSSNWKLVWSYLTLQLKTKTPESVAAVRRFVDSYTGTEEPRFVGSEFAELVCAQMLDVFHRNPKTNGRRSPANAERRLEILQ